MILDFANNTSDLIDQLSAVFGEDVVAQAMHELSDEAAMEKRLTMLNAARVAEANRTATDRALPGSGLRPTLEIPVMDYHYWGLRLGYECWNDKQFVAEYQRDNAAFVPVLEKKTNLIVHPGFPTPAPLLAA